MSVRYQDKIKLPRTLTLEDIDALIERLREHGSAGFDGREGTIEFAVWADNLWDLHVLAQEAEQHLEAYWVRSTALRPQAHGTIRIVPFIFRMFAVRSTSFSTVSSGSCAPSRGSCSGR